MESFDIRVRVLSCERCGAPLQAPEAGGSLGCSYCGTTMMVEARRLEPVRPNHVLEEDARIAKLRLQLDGDLAQNPYSTVAPPPGCGALTHAGLEDVQVQLAQRFREAVALVRAEPTFEHQRLAWWCATQLNQGYGLTGKHLERRAVLERTIEELSDP
ncbi:MAG: hypothetical protein KC457_23170, partial [Myxococcales bacterium]|nr:hypothetical protein [Myxococcales bacterium]